MTTATTTSTAARAAAIVSHYFSAPIASLEATAALLGTELAASGNLGALSSQQLDALVEPHALATVSLPEVHVYGAGFIAAVGLLTDERNHLSWWQGDDPKRLLLAAQSVNKEHIDYSELEWFRVPMETGRGHVAGPYVDYLCSDEYTITIAAPVHIDGTFVGVAGLDLLIDSVERQLLPKLAELGDKVTLVNSVGRVVISTDPRHATGDAVRGGALAELPRTACEGVALEIIAE
ncbi:cache domain-containing protein [Salinibacterium sp. PAMC 21357]|uniref:cache domain-containing protein n=1 Tax=Salinibacterium sp. PAMC 21357 TaxID=1112215 RepID=UPI0002886153|nr:cache domain-containing protein [Salinibacterium sp. PAMC 21357]